MPAAHAHHYTLIFPRIFDEPRPAWPPEVIESARAVPGLVDVVFPDLSATWTVEGDAPGTIRSESRRRFVELFTNAATPAKAKETDDAVRALALELLELVDAGAVTLVKTDVTDVEVIERGEGG